MNYSKEIEGYFFSPQHVGTLDTRLPLCISYQEGSEKQGLMIVLTLVGNESGLILKARFKAFANPYYIAGLEWLCQHLEGSSFLQPLSFDFALFQKALDLREEHYPLVLKIESLNKTVIKFMQAKLKER